MVSLYRHQYGVATRGLEPRQQGFDPVFAILQEATLATSRPSLGEYVLFKNNTYSPRRKLYPSAGSV